MAGFLSNLGGAGLGGLGPQGAAGSFLQNILSGGSTIGSAPIFTKKREGLELDKDKKIKVDPITGEKIKKKDRISFKRFKRNPFGITPGSSLNMNIPNILTGQNLAGAPNLGAIIAGVSRLGGQ